jgi:uncharacterized protein YggE
MKVFGTMIAAAAVLAFAGCGGERETDGDGARPSSSELAQQTNPSGAGGLTPQGITVVGTGTVNAAPDVAAWSFGVRSEGGNAREALAANAAAARRVIAALRSAGVKRDDIRTEQVSLWTQTDDDGRTVRGYTASNTVRVTARIARAGAIVDAAVRAGANEVSGPALDVSESDEQYAQALDDAFDDAVRRAEAIATKAGVTLGRPLALVEGSGAGSLGYSRYAAETSDLAVPIEPGRQDIQATLTVTFAIS